MEVYPKSNPIAFWINLTLQSSRVSTFTEQAKKLSLSFTSSSATPGLLHQEKKNIDREHYTDNIPKLFEYNQI